MHHTQNKNQAARTPHRTPAVTSTALRNTCRGTWHTALRSSSIDEWRLEHMTDKNNSASCDRNLDSSALSRAEIETGSWTLTCQRKTTLLWWGCAYISASFVMAALAKLRLIDIGCGDIAALVIHGWNSTMIERYCLAPCNAIVAWNSRERAFFVVGAAWKAVCHVPQERLPIV